MVSAVKRILVTSALPYANGPIHLGHVAGAYLPADIFVRYHRLKGDDILFICGSDEHGVPILLRAKSENTTPQKIVDYYHEKNKNSFAALGIHFDYYGRTSSATHRQISQDFFRKLALKKVFILKKDKQLYDAQAKMFLADRFVRGICPHCGYNDAYGDQCEKCGSALSPTDLLDPRSMVTDSKPVLKESVHWYLPLEKFQPQLEAWISTHSNWKPNVLGQIQSWFSQGLKDRAVTRDLSWGVPVPPDIAAAEGIDAQGKVLYVWFDAPIGYISATVEWASEQDKPELWKEYWQNQGTRLVHFIGKDNIVFHCLIFPVMLMTHGDYVLPDNVPANEFLNLEGNKFSTSRNYAVWVDEYLQEFEADSLRYCLASILPESKDADFSWKEFQARHNNELADILGNLVNRTLTFLDRHYRLKLPGPSEIETLDQELINYLKRVPGTVGSLLDNYSIRQALKEVMDLARFANKYFNDKRPWLTVKTKEQSCATTIYLCVETIKTLAVLLRPFIPSAADKIWAMLNLDHSAGNVWDQAGNLSLPPGHVINKPHILFTKIEDEKIARELEKLKINLPPKSGVEKGEQSLITLDDFKKVDLKVAEVLKAERLPKSQKLVKLQIRVGEEERQIIAGIANYYKPEDLIGKKIIVVINLQPVTLHGETSNGMLLAAQQEGILRLLTVDHDIGSGAVIS
jgi:methionyl-tRNA synthetase